LVAASASTFTGGGQAVDDFVGGQVRVPGTDECHDSASIAVASLLPDALMYFAVGMWPDDADGWGGQDDLRSGDRDVGVVAVAVHASDGDDSGVGGRKADRCSFGSLTDRCNKYDVCCHRSGKRLPDFVAGSVGGRKTWI